MSALTPTFSGEVMMAGWSDTHTSGAKVTFWLPDAESLEVFKGLTQKKGNTAGHRFMCVLVEIGDDEKPVQADIGIPITGFVEPETQSTLHKPAIGPLCMLAVQWCRMPEFWRWLETDPENSARSEMGAAACVKSLCEVESRKDIDGNPDAERRFHSQIRGPFSKYLLARGIVQ